LLRLIKRCVSAGQLALTVWGGKALVVGTWYELDDSGGAFTVSIPTPGAATRKDVICLRKSWANQTVRITRIAGVEGGGNPAMVQTPGVTWDVPLALLSITTGGVITISDSREFVPFIYTPTVIVRHSPGSL